MKSKRLPLIFVALLSLALIAFVVLKYSRPAPARTPASIHRTHAAAGTLGYEIIHEYPHDPDAYTQGLIFLDEFLYESTGITGRSSLRKVRLETGEVVQQRTVNPRDFADGLTEWNGRLVQLTPRRRGSEPIWHLRTFYEDVSRHFGDNVAVTWDLASLGPGPNFMYPGDGWGLTHDDRRLIMSDGSSRLRFLDPSTFAELSRLEIFDGDKPLENLNELEFVDGTIYANVLPQDRIALIQPDTGQVASWIDLAQLRSRMPSFHTEPLRPVLNGVAWDGVNRRLFVTGKLWPKVFEIRVRSK